jgi:hypothetical protein
VTAFFAPPHSHPPTRASRAPRSAARFDTAASSFETWPAETEDLDVVVDSGFGEVTRATVVGWAVGNINNRKSQLDYLQTMYGDLKIY